MTPEPERILAIDAGTSGVRASVVDIAGTPLHEERRPLAVSAPGPGLVEFDAAALADATRDAAQAALRAAGPVLGVGIANQRASSIVWDRASGQPVAPGQGWQDQRTAPLCAELAREGLVLLPSQSAPKLALLLDQLDPDRRRELCFGTVDSWLAWCLSGGALHITDASNAGATGLLAAGGGWDEKRLERLRIPAGMLPRQCDSAGAMGATSLLGMPPLLALVGDQQASLLGQGCVRRGQAKITFGSGAMLDVMLEDGPPGPGLGPRGTFPVIAWRWQGANRYAREALALTAGSCLDWLCEGLGVLRSVDQADAAAAACEDAGGVVFVPALAGLGAPHWDSGARGAFFGITRGTRREELVRAVLEGIAGRGADLVESAEADAGCPIPRLRVDGGMTASPVFLQALADVSGRPVEVAPQREATTLGAARLVAVAAGHWDTPEASAARYRPRFVLEPKRSVDRERWREALQRAGSRPSPTGSRP